MRKKVEVKKKSNFRSVSSTYLYTCTNVKIIFTWAGLAQLAELSLVTKIFSWLWQIISMNWFPYNKTKLTKLSNVIPVVSHGQYKDFF